MTVNQRDVLSAIITSRYAKADSSIDEWVELYHGIREMVQMADIEREQNVQTEKAEDR